ncbi:hypothetical protein [Anaerobutyricum hallii]|uniref:Uncharacterized protein n=1 Tax=Anaerobutyricum hallii TaxID=39488 RepID=A0A415TXF2_9FIRM|nr:hypothetical protein [Anaerobutyricum hallii]RHN10185.1 hypothetical protein DWZ29_13420 [Anaerobutyricum hallii]
MDVKELRDKLYEEYKDDLESCMSQYSHKFNYQDIADDVMDNVSKYFYGEINKDNILYLGSTSISIVDGKAGGVITTDGVYYLSWRFGSTVVYTYDELYRKVALEKNVSNDKWKQLVRFFDEDTLFPLMKNIALTKMLLLRSENAPIFSLKLGMVYSFIDIVSVFQKYKEENDRNRFYYKIYEAFSEPLIHEKKNIEELNFVDVICKYENIIKNYKENLKDVKIDGYHFNTQDELYRNILYWGSIFSLFVGFCVREIAVTYKDFITKIYKSIADQESLGMMSEEVNFLNNVISVFAPEEEISNWNEEVASSKEQFAVAKERFDKSKGFFERIYENITVEQWIECLSQIRMLIKDFCRDVSREKIDAVQEMIKRECELFSEDGYKKLDEIKLYEKIDKILEGMDVVISYMKGRAIDLSHQAIRQQKSMEICKDWLLNYPNNSVIIKGKHNKKLLEKVLKAQKILSEAHYTSLLQIHTVNGMSQKQFAFCQRMNASFNMVNDIRQNPPLIVIMINSFFLTGITFNLLNIEWRYLSKSPEAQIFDVLGDRRKAGIINTSKITKISYYKDVPFAMIKIDVKDNMVILPIILLEQKEAEKICKAIIEIYKSRGLFIPRVRKITLAEDEREKINRICEADGMEINNERYQKNKKDEITSFSSDSE